MKKTNVLWLILCLIFLIVFNALFFVIGGIEHNVSVWMSYGFIHFAYFMLVLTPKLIRGGRSSSVFGFSLYSISTIYFLIQFVTGMIFILVSPDSFNVVLLVQLCIAGLYGIMLISHIISNEQTAAAEEKRQYQIAYVKDASAQLKSILDSISDKVTKKKIERIYDAVNSSPIKSYPDIAQLENNILQSINELEDSVRLGSKEQIMSLANSLFTSVNERNMRVRTLNKK